MTTGIQKTSAYLLPGATVLLLLGFAAFGQNRAKESASPGREDSEQIMQQVSQELKSAREQVSKVDTDKSGHKYKLEQLLDQAEHEASDLVATYPKKR